MTLLLRRKEYKELDSVPLLDQLMSRMPRQDEQGSPWPIDFYRTTINVKEKFARLEQSASEHLSLFGSKQEAEQQPNFLFLLKVGTIRWSVLVINSYTH